MRKLTISLIVVVVTTILILGWGLGQYYAYTLGEQESEASSSELMVYESLGKALATTLNDEWDLSSFIENWRSDGAAELTLIDKEDFPVPESLVGIFEGGEPLVLESENEVAIHFYLPNHDQVVALVLPIYSSNEEVSINLVLTLVFYGGVILVVLVWLYPLIKRLNYLRKAAMSFGAGELQARVNVSPMSYIADIENEFNHMAERIETLVRDNKLLSRAVSHDLKTPLARLRFGIEMLFESQNEAQRSRYHSRLESDLNEMEQLVDTLLQFARLDESSVRFNMQECDLAKLCRHVINQKDTPAVTLLASDTTNSLVKGDKKYLAMMLNNIIDNALSHCHQRVEVHLVNKAGELTICVDDDGKGIPEEERAEVLKPFVRGKNSDDSKGHGMGLAIVSRIAEWHDAKITIGEAEVLGGASVRIRMPVNSSNPCIQ